MNAIRSFLTEWAIYVHPQGTDHLQLLVGLQRQHFCFNIRHVPTENSFSKRPPHAAGLKYAEEQSETCWTEMDKYN